MQVEKDVEKQIVEMLYPVMTEILACAYYFTQQAYIDLSLGIDSLKPEESQKVKEAFSSILEKYIPNGLVCHNEKVVIIADQVMRKFCTHAWDIAQKLFLENIRYN